jgi:hypothetical protein
MKIKLALALPFAMCLVHPAQAQTPDQPLVLRRVYAAPVAYENAAADALLSRVPDLLATRLTSLEPIVLVSTRDEAYSSILTTVKPGPNGGLAVEVRLFDQADPTASATLTLARNEPRYRKLASFIEATAADFAPRLGKVRPEVRLITVVQDEDTKRKVDAIDFDERMAAANELELRVGSLAKSMGGQSTQTPPIGITPPVTLSYTRFFDRFSGLTFQFTFERDSFMTFSYDESGGVKTPETSDNTFLMPGVGITVRSLGRLSTGFSFILSPGALNIEASYQPLTTLNLAQGRSIWLFYLLCSFRLSLCYNFTPAFSLKINTGMALDLLSFAAAMFRFNIPYSADSTVLVRDLLGLGASLRF